MYKIILDIEANGLKPTHIWCIVCKDIDTGELHVFRNLTTDTSERERFTSFLEACRLVVGHNILDYDVPVICRLLGLSSSAIVPKCLDTLIVSKLANYSRAEGHSLEAYGLEFNYPKSSFSDYTKYSVELENRCIADTEINYKVYLKYLRMLKDPKWDKSITLEHSFQLLVNDLRDNGFSFNKDKATKLLAKVSKELSDLDIAILKAFPKKTKLVRVITPKATKHNTISLTSIPKVLRNDIKDMNVDCPFSLFSWEEFNPSSHKQIIELLNKAGWSPTDKTQTHIDTERELNRLKYTSRGKSAVDLGSQYAMMDKLALLQKTGWKVNENNLSTLPEGAPAPARLLAKRILLESRRRTLTEWLSLVSEDGRIRGRFYGIGAWTHRMAHQQPNTANIPSEFKEDGSPKLLGREMRSLWQAPRNRLLVGVDAEGIQLRIFAHYIDDEEFTYSLVHGKKEDKSDPHNLNKRVLGDVCKTRQAAKRFIFALLLGGGLGKLGQILEASTDETRRALDRILERYQGFARLKDEVIPTDASRGWFVGLDGRHVPIPGGTASQRRHLCMSGYLQNGEAVVKKSQAVMWNNHPEIVELRKEKPILYVDMVHDEDQTECHNDMKIALRIAQIQAACYEQVGKDLNLKCPLAGSYWNDDHHDYTIGTNWYQTH